MKPDVSGTLVGLLVSQGMGILRSELALIRAEISRALRNAVTGLVMIAIALVVLLVAVQIAAQLGVEAMVTLHGMTRLEALSWMAGGLGGAALFLLLIGALMLRSARLSHGRD